MVGCAGTILQQEAMHPRTVPITLQNLTTQVGGTALNVFSYV